MSNKIYEGIVSSTKMEKTITVQIRRNLKEERTGKTISRRKKYKVHCIDSDVAEGDSVTFTNCSPISKDKRFRFLKTMRKAPTFDALQK